MIPVLPLPTKEEAEIFSAFANDKLWQNLEGYLKRSFDVVVAVLGAVNSSRDEDQVTKGMKLMIEEIMKLPSKSTQILSLPRKEEIVNLDERSTHNKKEETE